MTVTSQSVDLAATARQLTSGSRGILAADESIATMSKRLQAVGVSPTPANRRTYRQLLLTAVGLQATINGVIWCDETFGQEMSDGRSFPVAARRLGILPGIKVDTGTVPLPGGAGALVTEGLDGLGERLGSYAARGAAFAKWRAVVDVETMSGYSLRVVAGDMARYARLCQMHGIVPVVEPEVIAAGRHDLVASANAIRLTLDCVFDELVLAGVDLAGVVLKPSFVTAGLDAMDVSAQTVATITFDVLRDTVPPAVPGIAFLSGGHTTGDACAFLAELNKIEEAPWAMTFSFGRALVNDALETWAGSPANVTAAQRALLGNCERAARSVR